MRTTWTDERVDRELRTRDPQGAGGGADPHSPEGRALLERVFAAETRPHSRRGKVFVAAVVGTAAVVVCALCLPLLVSGRSDPIRHPTTTPYEALRSFGPRQANKVLSGLWQLADAPISGSWQQNTDGPPVGSLTCAGPDACYVMASRYASPDARAPVLSVSLYVTHDLGAAWDVVGMPDGFSPTTTLSCSAEGACAAGGTYDGQSIFIATTDGGSRWTMYPLPGVSGVLLRLSCITPDDCAGVLGPEWAAPGSNATPSDGLPDESFIATADGGTSWTTTPLGPQDIVRAVACPAAGHCLVAGGEWDPRKPVFDTHAFVRVTDDNGRTWTGASLPRGFSGGEFSALSCSDAQHCFLTGNVPITIANPPQCAGETNRAGPEADDVLPPMDPAVAAISKAESASATKAMAEEASGGGGFSCTNAKVQPVSDIASSSDGGRTWTADRLPSDVPDPLLSSISCPTSTECWASGSELVLEHVGTGTSADSPVLLGTTDGGSTWSKVVFSVPAGAPDAYGQSYLSMGTISCPGPAACIAVGATAQGAPTAPVYSLATTTSFSSD